MKLRPLVIVAVGLAIFVVAVAGEMYSRRGWMRTIAFTAWCAACGAAGIYYHQWLKRARARRGKTR